METTTEESTSILDTKPPWNNSLPFAAGHYKLRVISCEKTKAKAESARDQINAKLEITSPEEMEVNGETYQVSGTEILHYFGLDKTAAQPWGLIPLSKALYEKRADAIKFLGCDNLADLVNKFDCKENLLGLEFWAEVVDEVRVTRKKRTPEDILEGKKEGEAVLDENGKPKYSHWPRINKFVRMEEAPKKLDMAY